ncbi:hypothetical protein H7849_17995 [Alloacidobacterium dinghuense]|uniref:Uncharacterized protein n=1 Tax=Alloacidobacterium dinghuense TaxID=2763107 RepID=A0A7G8BEL9_9BACT|nr:hypothetical protein [Alloacidobacterium dinghuense]QNI30989.1 hypothetical protein H7849_17995 [Alloacidobacterium dinghuense]
MSEEFLWSPSPQATVLGFRFRHQHWGLAKAPVQFHFEQFLTSKYLSCLPDYAVTIAADLFIMVYTISQFRILE